MQIVHINLPMAAHESLIRLGFIKKMFCIQEFLLSICIDWYAIVCYPALLRMEIAGNSKCIYFKKKLGQSVSLLSPVAKKSSLGVKECIQPFICNYQ